MPRLSTSNLINFECVYSKVGLGRFGGDCFWGFQHNGDGDSGNGASPSASSSSSSRVDYAVPDIVTVGKPFGNGVPLAAVICRADIAEAMEATTVEYFNTFGGNPVACAAGLAVLEVLESEDLRTSAKQVRGASER